MNKTVSVQDAQRLTISLSHRKGPNLQLISPAALQPEAEKHL